MVISVSASTVLPATAGSAANLASAHSSMSTLTTRRRAEAAALDQNRLMAQRLARLQHFAIRTEHRHAAQSELDEFSAMRRLSTLRNSIPRNWIMSISIRPVLKRSRRLSTSVLGLMVLEERAVEQVDTDDPERLLLQWRPRHRASAGGGRSGSAHHGDGTGISLPSSHGIRCRP